ncbi:MAG: phosphodiester glycosidase family protein [Planctomycetota bacterium]
MRTVLCVLACLLACAAWAQQGSTEPPPEADLGLPEPRWRPVFVGVEHAELATDRPRPLIVQVLRVDLHAPGLSLFATPGNGDAPQETDGRMASAFLREFDLQAAINTHFFGPCCASRPGEPKDLISLSVAQGELVSPHEPDRQQDAFLVHARDGEEHASIFVAPDAAGAGPLAATGGEVAIGIGGRLVLWDGEPAGIATANEAFSTDRHPRTAIGLTSEQEIVLVAVDGRQPGFSLGASLRELAEIMRRLGCVTAINVDGGGSTTMVIQTEDEAPQLVNSPSGGTERVVGSHLGIRAARLGEQDDAGDSSR